MGVEEQTIELAGSPAFVRSAGATTDPPLLLLHDQPTSSDDWSRMLARTGGLAPDLPGFGRSGKGGQLDLTIGGHAAFLAALLDARATPAVRILAHGWGAAAGMLLAAQEPGRVERLVLVNPVPLTAPPAPARLTRVWRTPVLGELAMGSVNRRLLARYIRGASTLEAWPDRRVDSVWEQFDQGTQRAILRLHRAGTSELADALRSITVPVDVVRGAEDPRCSPQVPAGYAAELAHVETHELSGTRHWPWLERDEAAEAIAALATR